MAVQVRIVGLDRLIANLKKAGQTIEDLQQEALDKGAARMQRGGKGLGAQRNLITVGQSMATSREVGTSLNWPRTKGTAWTRFMFRVVPIIMRNVINKRKRQLESEWGS